MPKLWADDAPGRLPRSVMEPTAVATAVGLGGGFTRGAVAPSWSQPQASATARTSAHSDRRSIPPPCLVAGPRTCLRQDVRWPVWTDACQCMSSCPDGPGRRLALRVPFPGRCEGPELAAAAQHDTRECAGGDPSEATHGLLLCVRRLRRSSW